MGINRILKGAVAFKGPRPYIDVLAHGADYTGVVDATSAIQTAITLAAADGGNIVNLPRGTYKISGVGLVMYPGVILRGAGKGNTILSYIGSAVAITLDGTGDSWRSAIENLKIYSLTATTGILIYDACLIDVTGVWIEGDNTGFTTAGIHLKGTAASALVSVNIGKSCVIEECAGDGIKADNANDIINHIQIRDSRIRANSGYGIHAEINFHNWLVDGNDLEANALGPIKVRGAFQFTVSNNYFEQSANAILIDINTPTTSFASGISILNNHLNTTTNTALLSFGVAGDTYGVEGVTITGNWGSTANCSCFVDPIHLVGASISGNYLTPGRPLLGTMGANSGAIIAHDATGRSQVWGTAAPTTGTWKAGDVYWNIAMVSGGPMGWKCVVAGTPGTWDEFGYTRQLHSGWYKPTITASTFLKMHEDTGTVLIDDRIVMLRPGSITGVVARLSETLTAGSLTLEVYKNGVGTGLTAVLDATNPTFKLTTQAPGLDTFVGGDYLQVYMTFSAFTPTSADINVSVETTS